MRGLTLQPGLSPPRRSCAPGDAVRAHRQMQIGVPEVRAAYGPWPAVLRSVVASWLRHQPLRRTPFKVLLPVPGRAPVRWRPGHARRRHRRIPWAWRPWARACWWRPDGDRCCVPATADGLGLLATHDFLRPSYGVLAGPPGEQLGWVDRVLGAGPVSQRLHEVLWKARFMQYEQSAPPTDRTGPAQERQP